MIKKILAKLHNKRGMTLIEVVVSFAIVAIIAGVIIVGFRTMGMISLEGNKIDNIDQKLESQIATSSNSTIQSDTSLTTSDGSITIEGNVKEYTKNENGKNLTFRVFETKKD